MLTAEIILFQSWDWQSWATALGMLFSRNAIYSVLFLVLNFASVAVIYVMLSAPFIALIQITVYAGSIMVLFLFVIMLLGAEKITAKESMKGHRGYCHHFGIGVFA